MKKHIKRFIRKLPFFKASLSPENRARKYNQWSIGIYMGESPFDLTPPQHINNPVLTSEHVLDVQARIVADPFMLRVNGIWYMFFEVLNDQTGLGKIGLATSEDGLKWSYRQIVLREPFHLSYPYVFEWLDEYYMIPESYQANSIRLYKATHFPDQWSFVGNLLEGQVFLDSSVFRYDDKWWLFTETSPDYKYDTLRLYYAEDLLGPWLEHPHNPIVAGDPHMARPAGRVLTLNDRVIRYAQDCYPIYGTQVRAFEISELTTTHYQERPVDQNPILTCSGEGWNGSGMHHLDPHLLEDGRWIACVDGWVSAKIRANGAKV